MAQTRNQVLSLFGASPEQIMQKQAQEQAATIQAMQNPYQQVGATLGTALGRMFGGESAEVTRARELQQTLQGVDMTNPEQMTQAANILNKAGFPNEAMQLLSRAEEFRTSAQNRATAEARQQAAETELKRGRFERGVTTQSVDVQIGDETFSVPVQVETKIDRDTQDVTVTTSQEQMQARAKQLAQKLSREKDADARAKLVDQIKLENAKNEAALIKKQTAEVERKAGQTQGLAWVPFERIEIDADTGLPKKVSGHEYKAVTGTLDKDGKFVPNVQEMPEGAKVVDDKTGVPEGMTEFDATKTTKYTIGGTPVVRVGGQTFVVHTIQGKQYYDDSKPVDAEALRQEANQIAQQPVPQQPVAPQPTMGTRVGNRVTQRQPQATAEAARTTGLIQQITGQ